MTDNARYHESRRDDTKERKGRTEQDICARKGGSMTDRGLEDIV